MKMKLLFLILILHVSKSQVALNIDILGGEVSPSCGNNTGKMEFTSEYTISSQEEINSYFILNLKDSSNKKHGSICLLSFSLNSTQNGSEPQPSGSGANPSQSGANPSPSGSNPSPSSANPSQSGANPNPSGSNPSPSSANPSQSGANPNPSGSNPSPSSANPSQSGTEPKPSQNGTEPHKEDEIPEALTEIKAAVESLLTKYKDKLKNILSNKVVENVFDNLLYIIKYNIYKEKMKMEQNINQSAFMNISAYLFKLFKSTPSNFIHELKNLNETELKNILNSSISSIKQFITKQISKMPNELKIQNFSKVIEVISDILSEQNKTAINEKFAANLDVALTNFNTRVIQTIEKAIKLNGTSTNLKDLIAQIDNRKSIFESQLKIISESLQGNSNETYINDLINKINSTIYSLPAIIQEGIIEKKKPLAEFDKFIASLNNTNITNTIKKIISSFKNITSNNITDIILSFPQLFNKTLNDFKANAKALNLTLPIEIFQAIFENLTSEYIEKYFGNLSIEEIRAYIKNISTFIDTHKNDFGIIFNKTKKQVLSLLETINKANTTEITNIFKEQINIVSRIIKNITVLIKRNNLNITESLKNYINKDEEFKQLLEKLKDNNSKLASSLSTPEITKLIENIKNNSKYSIELEDKLTQLLDNLMNKLEKVNYTEFSEKLTRFNEKYLNKLDELKQSLNKSDFTFETIIPKIREMIENNLNSFNMTKFNEIYYKIISKWIDTFNKFMTTLKENNISLIEQVQQIKENMKNSNFTSILGDDLILINDYLKSQTNKFNNSEIVQILKEFKDKLEDSMFYNQIKPYLAQINAELKSKCNETKIREYIQNLSLLNRSELIEAINNTISQIDLEDSLAKLNASLNKIKDDIINDVKNETKIEEIKTIFEQDIQKLKSAIKNSDFIINLKQKINNTLTNSIFGEYIYEKIQNDSEQFKSFIDNINISEFINTTRIKEIISNMKTEFKKNATQFQNKIRESLKEFNESLYTFENKFFSEEKFDFSNLKKEIEGVKNKLEDAKIGEIPQIITEFMSQVSKYLQAKININDTILANENFIALNGELMSALSKIKDTIENSEKIKELRANLNNIQTTLKTLIKNIIELPFVQSYLINSTNLTLQNISDIKVSDLVETFEKIKERIKEDEKNLNGFEKVSEKINYIINKYYVDNNKLNNTLVNETLFLLVSFVEKMENSYKENQSEIDEEIYNKSKQSLNDTINSLNTTDILIKLNDTLQEFLNDILNLTDLILSNYDNLINMNTSSQSPKRKILTLKFVSKNLLENIKEKIISIRDSVSNFIERFKGQSVNNTYMSIRDTVDKTIRETFRKRFINILNSTQARNFYNSEALQKIIEILKNNGLLKDEHIYESYLRNLTKLIENINDTLNSNLTIREIALILRSNVALNYNYTVKYLKSVYELAKNFSGFNEYGNTILKLASEIGDFINDMFDMATYLKKVYENINGNNRLRFLSVNKEKEPKKNKRIRRVEETGSLTCKLDGEFDGDLTAESANINSFVIKSNKDYNINIKSNINIKLDQDTTNKCKNNNAQNIAKNINFSSIDTLKIDRTKKRFTFYIRIKIVRVFIPPPFFYLMMKVRMFLRSRHLRFLDSEEEVDTYCLPTDSDPEKFNCFGYSDNLDEKSKDNEVIIGNITSDYVPNIPSDITITSAPEAVEPTNAPINTNRYFAKSNNSGLSGGAIAGIVIACVAVVAIVAIVILLTKKSKIPNVNETSETIHNLQVTDKI